MIGILFENSEMTGGRAMTAFAGRYRTVDHDLLANHEIGALFGIETTMWTLLGVSFPEERLIDFNPDLVCGLDLVAFADRLAGSRGSAGFWAEGAESRLI